MARDINGKSVSLGDKVRILSLSGRWLDELPEKEKAEVRSMIGEVFEVEEIDEHGQAWVFKSWSTDSEDEYYGHSVALDPNEMELLRSK